MTPKRLSDPAENWPLPDWAYVPGRTARPSDDDEVHRIARAAPEPTVAEDWRDNAAWRLGLRLYANGYFWEAHEVWEAVWTKARPNSRERALVQGVIQLANAGLKQAMGRHAAAQRLAAMAEAHIGDAATTAGRLMGLDVTALREAVGCYRTALQSDPAAPVPTLCARTAAAPG